MCLAQGHKAVTLVRLEPAAPRSPVKHFTNEPLCFLFCVCVCVFGADMVGIGVDLAVDVCKISLEFCADWNQICMDIILGHGED